LGKIVIFAGGFGSGKSEIALNQALHLALDFRDVILADLDLVNPYFASRDVRAVLEDAGIRLVAPSGELSFGDVPSIPGEIIGLLRQENNMVIDVAGDEVGSAVLGYLSKYILARQGYEFFLVLNPYRPFAQELQSVRDLRMQLEKAASIEFTGIVSNPNLMGETTLDIIRRGHQQVADMAVSLDLPVANLTVTKEFYPEMAAAFGARVRKINLYLKPQWL